MDLNLGYDSGFLVQKVAAGSVSQKPRMRQINANDRLKLEVIRGARIIALEARVPD